MRISEEIEVPEREIRETFVRASGPGGQNVNRVRTAVRLRFDVHNSPSLDDAVKARLTELAGSRMTEQGVLVIRADRFRTQDRNRQDARARLAALLQQAAVRPRRRRKTRPPAASRAHRLEMKRRRARVKKLRASPRW
ncbi:MAG: aminoacyl-tRNA hydrolase [Deltaproteobacteria bacterium]|nr:aminoacyl-tRNA hydrolase [Deltaproteobacteria bacterium]MBW1924343.1 aminoacyl-tRNA hydrolase [Deltaproteobacteria bacterium]MBW1948482.1 aminoacyl-tRNA hydrolase [Deltaproteobacteria bacterium]MBW2007494.1 aminoacyl-tRNA hydrolase [Deltaproteobacteria bacterium]MBW2102033.1 aminoacyl-tRNA hydrolase [Deltaproteobacteria bacterium]